MKDKVMVLISTYNGEKYLEELLDSVLKQKNVDVDILIRDDGSTDNTINIIKKYAQKESNIEFFVGKNIGYAKSFWNLIKKTYNYKYYAFCDQDDIWQNNKLEQAVKMINDYSTEDIPILYTSNVISVNNNMEIISHNAFNCKKTLNIYESFQKSILPGCTFVFNDNAAQILKKYDGYMESHDWAAYTIVTTFGKVLYDTDSYIYYRIHENNTIGKKNSKVEEYISKIKRFFKKSTNTRSKFARDFFECYNDLLPDKIREEIKDLAYYKENYKFKIKLLFNKHFKGIIFKLYVLMNRI